MRTRVYVAYALLLAVAAAAAIAAGDSGVQDKRPSIESNGPQGLRALYLYLKESKRPVSALQVSPAKGVSAHTLVIAAPEEREITQAEVTVLQRFVEGGGTLVYLAPRKLRAQPSMNEWLGIDRGQQLAAVRGSSPDAEAAVWLPAGALSATRSLMVAAERTVHLTGGSAVPVAGQGRTPVLWHVAMGKGDLWIAAGPDLASNGRIDQGDDLAFWDHLSQLGPLAFDEFHQRPGAGPPMSRAALAFAAQFLLMGCVFAWSRGTRLGPPRTPPDVRHRASREYLTAFAHLMRRARVEGELATEMHQRLRRTMRERIGIPLSLPDEEVAPALEAKAGVSANAYLALVRALRAASSAPLSERAFFALAREVAQLEAQLSPGGGQAGRAV